MYELNCNYYPCVFSEKDINHYTWSKIAKKVLAELQKLMTVCYENFYHAQKLQKQANNKGVKPRSYVFDNEVWLNNKYIKTKQSWKPEAKFFEPF